MRCLTKVWQTGLALEAPGGRFDRRPGRVGDVALLTQTEQPRNVPETSSQTRDSPHWRCEVLHALDLRQSLYLDDLFLEFGRCGNSSGSPGVLVSGSWGSTPGPGGWVSRRPLNLVHQGFVCMVFGPPRPQKSTIAGRSKKHVSKNLV